MSSHIDFLGTLIIYPRMKITVLNKYGNKTTFEPTIFKYFVVSSFMFAAYFSFKIITKLLSGIKDLYIQYRALTIKKKNLALIFGFGDSLPSVKLTKSLIFLGFDLILINNKQSIENIKTYSLDISNDSFEAFDNADYFLSYEEILRNPKILKEKIGKNKINFIFDFTYFTPNPKLNKSNESNKEINKDNDYSSERVNRKIKEKNSSIKDFNIKDELDKNLNENLRKKSYHESFDNTKALKESNKEILKAIATPILYSEDISRHINEIIFINENLIEFMNETKIFLFSYKDKKFDFNHRLMVDFKNDFFTLLKDIPAKKINFITYVKKIEAFSSKEYRRFTEEDGISIIRYSYLKYYEYSFV